MYGGGQEELERSLIRAFLDYDPGDKKESSGEPAKNEEIKSAESFSNKDKNTIAQNPIKPDPEGPVVKEVRSGEPANNEKIKNAVTEKKTLVQNLVKRAQEEQLNIHKKTKSGKLTGSVNNVPVPNEDADNKNTVFKAHVTPNSMADRIATMRNNNSIILLDQKDKDQANELSRKDIKRLRKMDVCRVDLSQLTSTHGPKLRIKACSLPDYKMKYIYVNNEKSVVSNYSPQPAESSSTASTCSRKPGPKSSLSPQTKSSPVQHGPPNKKSKMVDNQPEPLKNGLPSHQELGPSSSQSPQPESHSLDHGPSKNSKKIVGNQPQLKLLSQQDLGGRDETLKSPDHPDLELPEIIKVGVYNLIGGKMVKVADRLMRQEEKGTPVTGMQNSILASAAMKRIGCEVMPKEFLLKLAVDRWDPVAKKVLRNPEVKLERLNLDKLHGKPGIGSESSSPFESPGDGGENSTPKQDLSFARKKNPLVPVNGNATNVPEESKKLLKDPDLVTRIKNRPSLSQSRICDQNKSPQEFKLNSSTLTPMEGVVPKQFSEPSILQLQNIFNTSSINSNITNKSQLEKLGQMLMNYLCKLKNENTNGTGATLTIRLGQSSVASESYEKVSRRSIHNKKETGLFSNDHEPIPSCSQSSTNSPKQQFLATFDLLKNETAEGTLGKLESMNLNNQPRHCRNLGNRMDCEHSSSSESISQKSNLKFNLSILHEGDSQCGCNIDTISALKNENDRLQKLLNEKNHCISTLKQKLKFIESICKEVNGPAKPCNEGKRKEKCREELMKSASDFFFPEVTISDDSSPSKRRRKQNSLYKGYC